MNQRRQNAEFFWKIFLEETLLKTNKTDWEMVCLKQHRHWWCFTNRRRLNCFVSCPLQTSWMRQVHPNLRYRSRKNLKSRPSDAFTMSASGKAQRLIYIYWYLSFSFFSIFFLKQKSSFFFENSYTRCWGLQDCVHRRPPAPSLRRAA